MAPQPSLRWRSRARGSPSRPHLRCPYILAPYVGLASEAEFDVDFSPTITGSFSAFLAVNSINIVLQGTSVASAAVTLSGSQTPLTAGAVVTFGSVAWGQRQPKTFLLSNAASSSVTVSSVSVSGSGFSGPSGLTTPVSDRVRTIRIVSSHVHAASGHAVPRHAHGRRPHVHSCRPRR